MSSAKVTVADTRFLELPAIVPVMATKRNQRQIKRPRRVLYVREWREFMGTKAVELAIALDIERESYYRLEKNWWTINAGEMDIIATTIGVKPSQLWFPPPEKGVETPPTVDELMADIPENLRPAAIMALRGMAGK